MKKIIETNDVAGLEALLGETVLLMCENYFYTGKLVGVNDDHVVLSSPEIVYETGPWTKKGFTDSQPLGVKQWQVAKGKIESYGAVDV